MKKKIIILSMLLVFILSFNLVALAGEWRSGLGLSNNGFGINLIEYITNKNFGLYIDSNILEEDNIEKSFVRLGAKKYLKELPYGSFINASLIAYDEVDLNETISDSNQEDNSKYGIGVGGGYSLKLDKSWFANLEGGYSYIPDSKSGGLYIKASIDISWNSFFKHKKEKRVQELSSRGWSKKIIDLILERQIRTGMTPEQVLESWGKPDSKYTSGNYQSWSYENWGYQNRTYHNITLYFLDGKLDHWDEYESN